MRLTTKRKEDLINIACNYVANVAKCEIISARYETKFEFWTDRPSFVTSVKTNHKKHPDFWVFHGPNFINLYPTIKFGSLDETFTFHLGLTLRLIKREFENNEEQQRDFSNFRYDAFICHSSDDKESIVEHLAEKLLNNGYYVWYDNFEIEVGDSLREKIDKGLSKSNFGIVILSKSFFKKKWTQYELNSLLAREIEGQKVILPIWHGVTKKDILKYSPYLADKLGLNTSEHTLDNITNKLGIVFEKKWDEMVYSKRKK